MWFLVGPERIRVSAAQVALLASGMSSVFVRKHRSLESPVEMMTCVRAADVTVLYVPSRERVHQ